MRYRPAPEGFIALHFRHCEECRQTRWIYGEAFVVLDGDGVRHLDPESVTVLEDGSYLVSDGREHYSIEDELQ